MPRVHVVVSILVTALLAGCGGGEADLVQPGGRPVADDISFASGSMVPRGTFEHTFATAGTYTYHYSIHPTMRGTITVP